MTNLQTLAFQSFQSFQWFEMSTAIRALERVEPLERLKLLEPLPRNHRCAYTKLGHYLLHNFFAISMTVSGVGTV